MTCNEVVVRGRSRPGAEEIDQAKWLGKIKVKDRTAVNLLASEFGQGESEVLVLAGLSLRFLNVPLFLETGI